MIVNQKSLRNIRILLDLILLCGSFLIAAVYAQSFEILMMRDYMFILLLVLGVLWVFSSNVIGFYEDFTSRYFGYQFFNIVKNIIVQSAVSVIFIFLVKEDLFTRNFILAYSITLTAFISLRTLFFKRILILAREKGKSVRRVIIVGTGEIAERFYNMINSNPNFGFQMLGFVAEENAEIHGKQLLGGISDFENIIIENHVEEAVIALPDNATGKLDSIMKICNKHAVRTHIVPDYFKFLSKKFRIGMIGDFPIITVRDEPLQEVQWRLIKRAFDVIVSLCVIIFIVSWLFPVLILLQKLTTKGPVFFVQDRIGKYNKVFRCYKFRTMKIDEEKDGFNPATRFDPRITKFGHFLRISNLDELPQIFNILGGDMSLVGPRPHAIPYNELYREIFDEIKLRHLVKPGLTGWAQVHGLRGDVEDEEENKQLIKKRIEYDIWYIENWSLGLDIQIILLTIWLMIRGVAKGY
jgi:putative colanic acid biosynthesis UDP-glucose lipid carrier transferase